MDNSLLSNNLTLGLFQKTILIMKLDSLWFIILVNVHVI